MKRFSKIAILMCLVLCMFTACKRTRYGDAEVAFIEDYSMSSESKFESLVNTTIEQVVKEHGSTYRYYRMTHITDESFRQTVDLALSFHTKVIFVTDIMASKVLAIHDQYPNLMFVLIDSDVDMDQIGEVQNVVNLRFDEYELGYITGYVYGYHGYHTIAYLYETAERSIIFGYGLIYGYQDALSKQEERTGTIIMKCVDQMSDFEVQKYIAQEVTNGTQSIVSIGERLNAVVDAIVSQVSASMVCTEYEPVNPKNVLFEAHRGYASVIRQVMNVYLNGDHVPSELVGNITQEGLYISYLSSSALAERAKRAFDTFEDANRNGSIIIKENMKVPYEKMKLPHVSVKVNETNMNKK